MKIEVMIIDCERDEILEEIESMGFEWDWTELSNVTVSGSSYNIESFTMWLDSNETIWSYI